MARRHREAGIIADLEWMRFPDQAQAARLRNAIDAIFVDQHQVESELCRLHAKRLTETSGKLQRLLNAYVEQAS